MNQVLQSLAVNGTQLNNYFNGLHIYRIWSLELSNLLYTWWVIHSWPEAFKAASSEEPKSGRRDTAWHPLI